MADTDITTARQAASENMIFGGPVAEPTHRIDLLNEIAIDAYAEAGMHPGDEIEGAPAWVGGQYEAGMIAGDKMIVATTDVDDEVVRLWVLTLAGAISVDGLSFPCNPLGLRMFVGAARAAAGA